MIEIKVSKKEKQELLQIIEQQKRRIYETREENIEQFSENFEYSVQRLLEDGIITLQLIKTLKDDTEIQLSQEDINKILENCDSEELEYWKAKIEKQGSKIALFQLSIIYNVRNVLERNEITLEPKVIEQLLLLERTRFVSSDEPSQLSDDNIAKIETGKIPYKLYRKNFTMSQEQEEIQEELEWLYESGIITEEQLLRAIGSRQANPDLESEQQQYEKTKRLMLLAGIEDILQIDLTADIFDENKQKIKELIARINENEDLPNADIKTLESIINEFNDIANSEWIHYIENDKNRVIFHASEMPIEGKFKDAVISTSLVTPNHTNTYVSRRVGYSIRPKHISRADSKDVYVFNARKDKYAQHARLVVKLPQFVEQQMMQDKTYSELVIEDFEIEAVMSLDMPKDIELLSRYSEAQGGIPIKVMCDGKVLTLEELEQERALAAKKAEVTSSVKKMSEAIDFFNYSRKADKFGIPNPSTKYTDIAVYVSKIQEQIAQLEEKMEKGDVETQLIDKIDRVCKNSEYYKALLDKCNQSQERTYIQSLGNKMQKLIANAQRSTLDTQYRQLEQKRFGILGKISGRSKLQKAMMRNIMLKKQKIIPEEKEYTDRESIARDFYEYIKLNNITDEMRKFWELYVEQEGRQLPKTMLDKINLLIQSKRNEEKSIQTVGKTNWSNARKRAKQLEIENRQLTENAPNIEKKREPICEKVTEDIPTNAFAKLDEYLKSILQTKENVLQKEVIENNIDK